jgi:hypothetical protein
MSDPPQAIAPIPHSQSQSQSYFAIDSLSISTSYTNVLNVYIQIANKMGFQKKKITYCSLPGYRTVWMHIEHRAIKLFYRVGFPSEDAENSVLWSIRLNICQVVYLHSHNKMFSRTLHLLSINLRGGDMGVFDFPAPEGFIMFYSRSIFYGEGLLAPRPTPKLEYHPLSDVCGCLFNVFTANLQAGGRPSICDLRTRHAVVTGTHLDASNELRTFSVRAPHNWCTAGDEDLSYVPALPHSESDVIHLFEQQCLLSRTVNKAFNAIQAITKL